MVNVLETDLGAVHLVSHCRANTPSLDVLLRQKYKISSVADSAASG